MPDIVYVYIVSLIVGILVILLGISYFLKKREDDTEDDLGYLEYIVSEKGGKGNEEEFQKDVFASFSSDDNGNAGRDILRISG